MEKNAKASNAYTVERLLKNMEDHVARFRVAKGYTLDQLSKQSGVAISRLSEIESGDAGDIQLSTVVKIAQALGCVPFELLGAADFDLDSVNEERLDQAIALLLSLSRRKTKRRRPPPE